MYVLDDEVLPRMSIQYSPLSLCTNLSFLFLFSPWGQVRVVNFNVYMGYDRRGEGNAFRVAGLLNQLDADVAALQVGGVFRSEVPTEEG